MQVQSLGWKDPQGVGIGNLLQYSCWKVPRAAESGGLQSMGLKIDTAEHTHTQSIEVFRLKICCFDRKFLYNI